jgi:invasion protein IalB
MPFTPIDSNGTMMTIDTSTPARFIIKLALDNKTVAKVRVEKPQFASLDVGESVKFKRWVGRSGRVYRQSILMDSST